jgi:hypothetical protein
MCSKLLCEYWKRKKPTNCFNEGWILDTLHITFWFLDKIAVINLITLLIQKRKSKYFAVDTYIFVLFLSEVYLLASLHFFFLPRLSDVALQVFIWWRLFGLFRVWITHFMEEVLLADRVVVMSEGELAMRDSPARVFHETEKLRSLGLDVPQIADLVEALQQQGIELEPDITAVEELVDALCSLSSAM